MQREDMYPAFDHSAELRKQWFIAYAGVRSTRLHLSLTQSHCMITGAIAGTCGEQRVHRYVRKAITCGYAYMRSCKTKLNA